MIDRRSFVAGALALIGGAPPSRALALVETPSGGGRTSTDGRLTLEATAVVVAALQLVRTVWRPPSVFPGFAPIAYYPGTGADPSYPNEPVIWLNPDHPELRAPRGWGVIYADFAAMARDQAGYESWVRAFVLATADRQPPESEQKRAYEAARAKDEAANGDRWAARRAFAAPYVRQVAALFGR